MEELGGRWLMLEHDGGKGMTHSVLPYGGCILLWHSANTWTDSQKHLLEITRKS